jgi:hypothetical protein
LDAWGSQRNGLGQLAFRESSVPGLTCGHDRGSRVAPDDYHDGFAFTGTIKRVTIDHSGDLIGDSATDMKVMMARQWMPPPGRSHRSTVRPWATRRAAVI